MSDVFSSPVPGGIITCRFRSEAVLADDPASRLKDGYKVVGRSAVHSTR
jgi:hypothetical protein